MFSKAISVAFLSLALSSFTAQALPRFPNEGGERSGNEGESCAAVSTVFVTVTAGAATATSVSSHVTTTAAGASSTSKGSNNSGSSSSTGNNNSGNNNNNKGTTTMGKAVITTLVTVLTTTTTQGNSNNNSNGKGNGNNNNGKGNTTVGVTTRGRATVVIMARAVALRPRAALPRPEPRSYNHELSRDFYVDLEGRLGSRVLAKGFENDGQDQPTAGQVPSLTSSNNFINFCAGQEEKAITNGQQITAGSCNPAIMGIIAATTNMPSSKFVFPPNFGTIKANTAFTIQMAIRNLDTGHFTNAAENYYAAPQQVNAQGIIIGHTHVVIEAVSSLTSTTPADPNKFTFFKGVNTAADQNGIVSASVDAGIPSGVYKLSSINAAANHQPVLVAVAQHASLDDVIYFTVTEDGKAVAAPGDAATNDNTTAVATSAAASSAAATLSANVTTSAVASTSPVASSAGASTSVAVTASAVTSSAATTTSAATKGSVAKGGAIGKGADKATETDKTVTKSSDNSGKDTGASEGSGDGASSSSAAATSTTAASSSSASATATRRPIGARFRRSFSRDAN
ncbi:hypothetical protein BC834DRAFT_1011055 [Gloeopeniophorella convolvens]|nr:hypothetical protein BC834DRAFT_1011055 [Gloeopeniophorella convolvens]